MRTTQGVTSPLDSTRANTTHTFFLVVLASVASTPARTQPLATNASNSFPRPHSPPPLTHLSPTPPTHCTNIPIAAGLITTPTDATSIAKPIPLVSFGPRQPRCCRGSCARPPPAGRCSRTTKRPNQRYPRGNRVSLKYTCAHSAPSPVMALGCGNAQARGIWVLNHLHMHMHMHLHMRSPPRKQGVVNSTAARLRARAC
jgi:hypothetical protein